MCLVRRKGPSGFTSSATAEQVTLGIDGSGLTAIVTGGTGGIGAETVRVLALRGVSVVMAVRNMAAGQKIKEAIVKEIPEAKVDAMELDLSSLASVRKFEAEFTSSGRPLNILINNAAVMGGPFKLSKDNIELNFATNHLGHFLLTNLLLDTMKKTYYETKREGRIVIVSSVGHRFTYREGVRFDRINDQEWNSGIRAYLQSKFANLLHANELARRLKEDGVEITVNSLHPGVVATSTFGQLGPFEGVFKFLAKYVVKNVQQGASTSCYVALHPQVRGISGEYFKDNNLSKPSSKAMDVDLARRLWDFSMNLVKKNTDDDS